MRRWSLIFLAILLVLALAGCSDDIAPEPEMNTTVPNNTVTSAETPVSKTFVNGVLETPKMRIEITEYRVLQVGEKGNEYGDSPVIAFWYNVTNLTDDDLNPNIAWIKTMTAIQDNDPNVVNTLSVGLLPDISFLDTQMQTIKKDGTVANAVSYYLSDTTTSVELVASDDLGLTTIGSMIFDL